MNLGLEGAVVVVTGASGGIGQQVARAVAAEGGNLAVGGRPAEVLETVAEDLRSWGSTVVAHAGNMAGAVDVDALVSMAGAQFGRIDGVAACVGSTPIGTFDELTDDAWQRSFESKFMASVRLVRASLPWLQRSAHGRIVLVGGNGRSAPAAHMATSGAMNAALANLAATLTLRYAGEGIGAVSVDPGPVDTKRAEHLRDDLARRERVDAAEATARILARIPDRRLADPTEIGRVVAWLLSPLCGHVSATSIIVDGGQSAIP